MDLGSAPFVYWIWAVLYYFDWVVCARWRL